MFTVGVDYNTLAPGLLLTSCVIASVALVYAYWRTGITQATFTALHGFLSFRAVHVPLVIFVGLFTLGFGLREAISYGSSRPELRQMTTKDIEKIVEQAKKADLDGAATQKMVNDFAEQVNKENHAAAAIIAQCPEPQPEPHLVPLSVAFGLMFSGVGLFGASFYLIFRQGNQN